jgi:HEAT repeat protein
MRSASDKTRSPGALLAACLLLALGAAAPPPANWLTDPDEAGRQGRLSGKPVLALYTLRADADCKRFEKVLADPAVAARLPEFVLFRYQLEDAAQAVQQLGIQAVPPVVAVVAPNGTAVARQEGYLTAGDFLTWLDHAQAQVLLMSPQALAQKTDDELAAMLGHRDPALREAVVTILAERGHVGPVVKAFASGGLAVRLSALEVLAQWGAPVEGADPWKPETVSIVAERLENWAATAKPGRPAAEPADEVARDLDLWAVGEDGPATLAAYERLARAGRDLLPQVRARTPANYDLAHERLTALRYRLVLPEETVRRDAELPFRMASPDADARVQAVAALTEKPGPALKDFFSEALSDPDGKVREAALRGLNATGTQFAREQIVALLADPSPEVRAGVLQELARAPKPELLDDLVAYAGREQEEDLVVQAAQALRELRDKDAAFDELIRLTGHASWRVRAAAIEALGSVSTSSSGRLADIPARRYPALIKALRAALKDADPFVVGKAVETLSDLSAADVADCMDDLAQTARQHPELAVAVMQIIASNRSLRARGLPLVREFCSSKDADLRAAGLGVLAQMAPAAGAAQFVAGLGDPAPSVRKAAAGAVLTAGTQSAMPFTAKEKTNMVAAAGKMAASTDTDERFSGLSVLASLGQGDAALPGLEEIVSGQPSYAAELARVMPGFPYAQRKQLFIAAGKLPLDQQTWTQLFTAVFSAAPRSDEGFLWKVLEEDPHAPAAPQEVLEAVLEYYGITSGLWYASAEPAYSTVGLRKQAAAYLTQGDAARRAMALLLLCRADRPAGLKEAERLEADEAAPPELRLAARQVRLASGDQAAAIAALKDTDERLRQAAERALVGRYTPFHSMPEVTVGGQSVAAGFLSDSTSMVSVTSVLATGSGVAVWQPPKLPDAFTPELLDRLSASQDSELALAGAYLKALKGDGSGLPALVDAWHARTGDYRLTDALPKAIAAVGDDANVKYLQEVYASFSKEEREYRAPDLYTSIRRMEGPQAQALRKQMRQDLGPALFR